MLIGVLGSRRVVGVVELLAYPYVGESGAAGRAGHDRIPALERVPVGRPQAQLVNRIGVDRAARRTGAARRVVTGTAGNRVPLGVEPGDGQASCRAGTAYSTRSQPSWKCGRRKNR